MRTLEDVGKTIEANYQTLSIYRNDYRLNTVVVDPDKRSITVQASNDHRTVELQFLAPEIIAPNADWGGSYKLSNNGKKETGTLSLSVRPIERHHDVTIYVMKTLPRHVPPPASSVCWQLKTG